MRAHATHRSIYTFIYTCVPFLARARARAVRLQLRGRGDQLGQFGRHSISNDFAGSAKLSAKMGREASTKMKTFGQVIVEARKAAGLTHKAVAERLCRGDGRKVLPPWLNDLEHDRRYPPENAVIEQLAELLHISADILYFYARRVPGDISGDFDDNVI